MSATEQYRLNQPTVISEVVDGEAVIVNLDSGAYFSLRDTGCVIWNLLIQGMPLADVVKTVGNRYGEAGHVIDAAVQALVAELLRENLLVAANSAALPQDLALSPGAGNGDRLPFHTPVLEKFTDMAELLLLDPIHDVQGTGWPHAGANDTDK